MSAFDDAVGVVLDWINASEERKQHTLLIVLADLYEIVKAVLR